MNDYKIMSESYMKAADTGTISRKEAEKKIRVFDFLAACDYEDIYTLFDCGAFNEIVKAYVNRIANDMIEENVIIEEIATEMCDRIGWLLDGIKAEEILKFAPVRYYIIVVSCRGFYFYRVGKVFL